MTSIISTINAKFGIHGKYAFAHPIFMGILTWWMWWEDNWWCRDKVGKISTSLDFPWIRVPEFGDLVRIHEEPARIYEFLLAPYRLNGTLLPNSSHIARSVSITVLFFISLPVVSLRPFYIPVYALCDADVALISIAPNGPGTTEKSLKCRHASNYLK